MPIKERISVTIDDALLEWIDERIASKQFANRSHAIEWCIKGMKELEQK